MLRTLIGEEKGEKMDLNGVLKTAPPASVWASQGLPGDLCSGACGSHATRAAKVWPLERDCGNSEKKNKVP